MFKGHCFPKSIILQAVYFKLRFSLSYRDVEELMMIRGVMLLSRDGFSKQRKRISAHKFLNKAIENNGRPELINIDKSGSNKSAIQLYNRRNWSNIEIWQCKYLNNIVEQDHRYIKWRINQGLGFKDFESAKRTIAGIEIVRMIKKDQLLNSKCSTYGSFLSLAA